VVAAGDCAAGCRLFVGSYACVGAVASVIPVDFTIPGCPPPPRDLLKGLIALIEA
jgi:Ni,Fe-hydrogenase III small subunit